VSEEKRGRIGWCACCQFPTVVKEAVMPPNTSRSGEEVDLCLLCGHSLIGNAYLYGRTEELPLVRAVAWVGNALLTAMEVDMETLKDRIEALAEEADER